MIKKIYYTLISVFCFFGPSKAQYCVPTGYAVVNPGGNNGAIGSLNIGNFYMVQPGGDSAVGYFDYTSKYTFQLNKSAGFSEPFLINSTHPFGTFLRCIVYGDWNQDSVFESSELNVLPFVNTSNQSYSGKLSIPSNAKTGKTRLRLMMYYQGGARTDDPCTEPNPTDGAVIDLLANVQSGVVPENYCIPSYIDGTPRIDTLSFGSLNKSFTIGEYINLTSDTVLTTSGATIPVYFMADNGSSQMTGLVYADWNENGIFEDSLELTILTGNANVFTGNVTVPSYFNNTSTRVRIISLYLFQNRIITPCQQPEVTDGSVIDFIIQAGKVTALEAEQPSKTNAVKIIPNPFENNFMILNADGANYQLFSAQGQLISKGIVSSGSIDCSGLNTGFYLLYVNKGGENQILKLVKK